MSASKDGEPASTRNQPSHASIHTAVATTAAPAWVPRIRTADRAASGVARQTYQAERHTNP